MGHSFLWSRKLVDDIQCSAKSRIVEGLPADLKVWHDVDTAASRLNADAVIAELASKQ